MKYLFCASLLLLFVFIPRVVFADQKLCTVKGRVLMKTFESLDSKTVDEINLRVIESSSYRELATDKVTEFCSSEFGIGQVIRVAYPKENLKLSGGNVIESIIRVTGSKDINYGVYMKDGKPSLTILEEYGYTKYDIFKMSGDLLFTVSDSIKNIGSKIDDIYFAINLVLGRV